MFHRFQNKGLNTFSNQIACKSEDEFLSFVLMIGRTVKTRMIIDPMIKITIPASVPIFAVL